VWLVGACREPVPAYALLARCREARVAPVPDRALVVALALLVEGGAVRVTEPAVTAVQEEA
jgi:hypothetical protein